MSLTMHYNVTQKKHLEPRVAFGEAVRKFRREKGISQEALADLAGIHRTYIGDVERGVRNLSLLNIVRIAQALEIPVSKLVIEMERQM